MGDCSKVKLTELPLPSELLDTKLARIGLVAIGRNEGQRLLKCLLSAIGKVAVIVYVDSGSTDGSVSLTRSHGVDMVELFPREKGQDFYPVEWCIAIASGVMSAKRYSMDLRRFVIDLRPSLASLLPDLHPAENFTALLPPIVVYTQIGFSSPV